MNSPDGVEHGAAGGDTPPRLNLVYPTLIGNIKIFVDTETGEKIEPLVRVNYYDFKNGGELVATYNRRAKKKPRLSAKEKEPWQRKQNIMQHGAEKEQELALERKEEKSSRSTKESARRARTCVRRFARAHSLKYLLTFTYPAPGMHDYDTSYKHVSTFLHHQRKLVCPRGEYLGVPELHPKGHGFHWHVLLRYRCDINAIRLKWTEFLERRGIAPSGGAELIRVHVKSLGSSSKASAYASKYVGKTFEKMPQPMEGRNRYITSRGAKPVPIEAGANSFYDVLETARNMKGAYIFKSQDDDEWTAPPTIFVSW